jgi:hypothetical protein
MAWSGIRFQGNAGELASSENMHILCAAHVEAREDNIKSIVMRDAKSTAESENLGLRGNSNKAPAEFFSAARSAPIAGGRPIAAHKKAPQERRSPFTEGPCADCEQGPHMACRA